MSKMQRTCENCINYKPRHNLSWRAQSATARWLVDETGNLKRQPGPSQIAYTPPPTAVVVQPGARIETPVAQQSIESSVKVPLAQSVITGGFIGAMTICGALYLKLPKPVLITAMSTLGSTFWTWKGSINFADSLLTRIEDYTGIDVNRDGVTGSKPTPRQPAVLRLIKSKSDYTGTQTNEPAYVPATDEQIVEIPNLPKADIDPMTVQRLAALLEQAFATQRWSRAHHKELGISQGQWSVLSKYLGPGEDGKGYNVWGTKDHPALQAFIDQISVPVNQPTN